MPRKKQEKQNIENAEVEKVIKSSNKKPALAKSLKKHSAVPAWIVAGLLVVFIVVLFVYAQSSLSKVKQDKKEMEAQTKVLKSTINTLQQQVSSLNDKTNTLEESARKSNEYLFAENISKRKLPDSVDTKDWQLYKDEEWKMEFLYPKTWQISQSAQTEAPAAEGEQKAEARKGISLEPVGESDFLRSMQIMSYSFGKELSMDDKIKEFEGKGVVDTQDFNGGKLIYFIEQANDLVIPTVMILTDSGDYKVIFRVNNLFNAKYFDYLADFEKMIAAIKIETAQPAEEPKAEQPAEEEEKKEE